MNKTKNILSKVKNMKIKNKIIILVIFAILVLPLVYLLSSSIKTKRLKGETAIATTTVSIKVGDGITQDATFATSFWNYLVSENNLTEDENSIYDLSNITSIYCNHCNVDSFEGINYLKNLYSLTIDATGVSNSTISNGKMI